MKVNAVKYYVDHLASVPGDHSILPDLALATDEAHRLVRQFSRIMPHAPVIAVWKVVFEGSELYSDYEIAALVIEEGTFLKATDETRREND